MQQHTRDKIFDLEGLIPVVREQQKQGKKIVFTNGCFDLIHVGHTRYLNEARNLGDALIIAVNSDDSVRALKGDKRPLISQEERMEVLAGLYFVDYVLLFNELDPYKTIAALRPNVLTKGGDWPVEKIIGNELVFADGGNVCNIPFVEGNSTTKIIERICSRYCGGNVSQSGL